MPDNYATIAAAEAIASAGDSIIVGSTYSADECVTINKAINLSTKAANQHPTVKGFLISATSGVTIDRFTITNTDATCAGGWGFHLLVMVIFLRIT